ncbi:hypothetical protein MHYP_G00284080 [Metynnis hypsauchen]
MKPLGRDTLIGPSVGLRAPMTAAFMPRVVIIVWWLIPSSCCHSRCLVVFRIRTPSPTLLWFSSHFVLAQNSAAGWQGPGEGCMP